VAKHMIAPVDQFPAGTRRIVNIEGRSIGIFNIDGRFYALRNRCPHQGGPLCDGTILSELEADGPGSYRYNSDVKLLQCPWHGWEYDFNTGQSWWDPVRTRVRQYPVSVESGSSLEMVRNQAGRVPGPYLAETFPVEVERDYVVVEVLA